MQVKYVLEQLSKYHPEDEIVIVYWDKPTIETVTGTMALGTWLDLVGVADDHIDNTEFDWCAMHREALEYGEDL